MSATLPQPKEPRVVVGFWLLIGAILSFVAAIIAGYFIDMSRPPSPYPVDMPAIVGVPIVGSLVYAPLLIASAVVSVLALRRRVRSVMAWCTLVVAGAGLVPSVPLFGFMLTLRT